MYSQGPIASEPQYICDVCGKKKPVSQMAGKCVTCGKYVCSQCANLSGDKVYCAEHAPEEKRGGCFIATAAYGTVMVAEIDTLRDFRDRKLNLNILGKNMVRLYYAVSPPIANVIARSENMRALVRLNLKPIIHTLKSRNHSRNSKQ